MGTLPNVPAPTRGVPAPKRHSITPAVCLNQAPIPPPADYRAAATATQPEPCTWRCCAAGEAPARCPRVRAELLDTIDAG